MSGGALVYWYRQIVFRYLTVLWAQGKKDFICHLPRKLGVLVINKKPKGA